MSCKECFCRTCQLERQFQPERQFQNPGLQDEETVRARKMFERQLYDAQGALLEQQGNQGLVPEKDRNKQ